MTSAEKKFNFSVEHSGKILQTLPFYLSNRLFTQHMDHIYLCFNPPETSDQNVALQKLN